MWTIDRAKRTNEQNETKRTNSESRPRPRERLRQDLKMCPSCCSGCLEGLPGIAGRDCEPRKTITITITAISNSHDLKFISASLDFQCSLFQKHGYERTSGCGRRGCTHENLRGEPVLLGLVLLPVVVLCFGAQEGTSESGKAGQI